MSSSDVKTKRAARQARSAADVPAAGLQSTSRKRVGRPPAPPSPRIPDPWERAEIAAQVQEVLDALEAPPIDDGARLALQRMLFRCGRLRSINPRLAMDGRARVTLVVRTIVESEGNRDALTEPVIQAVSISMRKGWTDKGLAWIEAFDRIPLQNIVSTMRSLNLFKEEELGYNLSIILSKKLLAILGPALAA